MTAVPDCLVFKIEEYDTTVKEETIPVEISYATDESQAGGALIKRGKRAATTKKTRHVTGIRTRGAKSCKK